MANIEALKKQVDEVKIDLNSLKNETNESLKKTKAEVAAEKIEKTKGEINKKLEELNGLTDAKSQEEITQLETMLTTLKDSSDLEEEVITPIKISPEKKEWIDNSSDFESITSGIAEMKTMSAEIQTMIDEYKKVKSTLSDADKTAKETAIDAKKIILESKRKEVQAIIDKIKKSRTDMKLDEIDDATMKAEITKQKEAEEKSLKEYETQLNAVETPATTFFEKVKNGVNKAWEKTKEGTGKAWEWTKENPWKAAGIATGVGLLIRGISKLFKKDKKSEGGEAKKEEKSEKMSRWKKALIWAGIWTGWVLIWKNWDKIKSWFTSDTDKPKEKVANDFEDLSEEMKEKYYTLSSDIDTYTDSSTVTFEEETDDDQKVKWEMLFRLDKQSKNLYDFSTNSTLDYIQDETTPGILANIMNWGKDKIYGILWPHLSRLASFQPFGLEFVSDPIKGLNNRLKAATPEEQEKALFLCYTEYMNILNYIAEKKKVLVEKLAKEEVMGKEHLKDTPTEDQQDAIEDLLDSDQRRKWKVDIFFKKHSLAELPSLTKEYTIETSDISTETQEVIDGLNEERDDILQKDDEWTTAITRAEVDFEDGTLDEDSRDELTDVCEDLLDIEFGDSGKSFFGAYTHLITDIFAGNKELADSFMEKTKLKEVSEEFKATLTGYLAKLKANTFTQEDLQELKKWSEGYFKAKEKYELSMNNIKDMSSLEFNRWKLLSLPYNAALDVAQGFGKGKATSWRERIWRGMGGLYISWQTLYITWSIAQGFGKTITGGVLKVWGKVAIEIWKLPITLAEKWFKLLTGRSFLTWRWRSNAILNSKFSPIEKERLVKYAFLHGEISEKKALKLYETMWNKTIKDIDGLLEEFWIHGKENIKLFKKYSENKNIKKLLIEPKTYKYQSRWDNFEHTFVNRILKKDIVVNTENFKKLSTIDATVSTLTTKGSKEALFREEFLKNTKTLDKVDDMLKNSKIMWLLTQVWQTSDDAMKLSKILAQNFHKFDSLVEMEWYLNFLKTNKSSITNANTFISNTIGKRSKLKLMDQAAQTKYIETAKLNTTFLERRIVGMKDNFKKSAETIRNLIKNKKTPYPAQVEAVANGLDEIAKVDNETLSAMQAAPELWKSAWIGKMNQNKNLLKEIAPLFKDQKFLKELSKAKTPEAIRGVFKTAGKELPKDVPVEFITTLAKTKSTKKMTDTINYINKYDELTKILKILKSPGMKYASRVFGRVLAIAWFGFGVYSAFSKFNEANEIEKTNKERAGVKRADAWRESWFAVAAGVEALGAFGALAGIETACAFVPGIGWIAGWVILGVSYIAKDMIFETLDKYNNNYKDLLGQAPLAIREHILTTIIWGAREDRSTGEWMVWIFKNMDHLSKKTWSEGIKALLYTEEWKNNPLAMVDIQDTALMAKLATETPPITREQVAVAVDQIEKNVQLRYEYLKKKCGVYKKWSEEYIDIKKIITLEKIKNGEWFRILDRIILESQYHISNPEVFEDSEKIIQHKTEMKKVLHNDKKTFESLEWLFDKDKQSLLYIYRYLNEFGQHLDQFWVDESGKSIEANRDVILKNIEYFDTYMQYKTLEEWIDIWGSSAWFIEADFIKVRDFLVAFKLDKPISDKELYNSTNKLQTILYRIATEVIGVRVNNTMDELKNIFNEDNEKKYWLYYHDNKLDINGDIIDNEYVWADIETIKKIRMDIQEQIHDNDLIDVGTWDTYLNKEIGNKYLKIIDQELARS